MTSNFARPWLRAEGPIAGNACDDARKIAAHQLPRFS